jgi:hypothetical protein
MALAAPVQTGARKARLQGVDAIVKRQQRLTAETHDHGFMLNLQAY